MKNGVNIYDFDGIIYDGDSSIDFYLFCLKRNFKILLCLPLQFYSFILFKLGIIDRKEFKEKFFCFLKFVKDLNEVVTIFWKDNFSKIKPFYLEKKHDNDIIISNSLEFLIKCIGDKLKVKDVIATKMNNDGTIIGEICYGEEKVKRFKEKYGNLKVKNVYTNSLTDISITKLGKKSFIVDKNKIILIGDKQLNRIRDKKVIKKKKILNLLFIVSVPFITLLLCGDYNLKYLDLLLVLSFISGIFINKKIIKNNIYDDLNFRYLVFSILFSFYSISIFSDYSEVGIIWINNIIDNTFKINYFENLVGACISILALPSMVVIVYFLSKIIFPFIKKELLSLSKMEKKFLIVVGIVGFILTTIIYNKTNVFYYPTHNGYYSGSDIIYTTDSGELNSINAYTKVGACENDIRQPLFGIFAFPFAASAKFISSFLNFIPNSYYIIFNVIQILLLAISLIFIERMMNLKNINKLLFLLLSLSTFSVILFSFVYEQYIIALFYLVLTLYIWFFYKKDVNYCYVGAVGTLLTSGIILSAITKEKISNFSKYARNIFKCFICFLIISILSGQILMIFNAYNTFKLLMIFSGKELLFIDKLKQFLYFVSSIFIAPVGNVALFYKGYQYKLINIDFISIFGIEIILLCFISFIINRKNLFAKISFMWIIFSFVILCLFGWGTRENGLILYSLYFFWAYVSLISLLINKAFRNKYFKIFIYFIIIFIMLYFNLSEFIRIVQFGISYYSN